MATRLATGLDPRLSRIIDRRNRSPQESEFDWLGDLGKAAASGIGQLESAIGAGAELAGAEDFGKTLQEIGDHTVDWWLTRLSDGAKEVLAKKFITYNDETDDIEFTDSWFKKAALLGAQSAGMSAASIAAGAGLTKALQAFANPAGRAWLVSQSAAGSPQAAKTLQFVDDVLAGAGFGASEGALSGASTSADIRRQLDEMPHEELITKNRYRILYNSARKSGLQEAEAQEQAREAHADFLAAKVFKQAAVTTGILGAPTGMVFGRTMGLIKGADGLSRVVNKTGRAGAAGIGAVTEGAQEAAQSATEKVYTNLALDKDPTEDLLDATVGGALGGSVAGAAFGTARSQAFRDPAPQTPKTPKTFSERLEAIRKATAEREQAKPLAETIAEQAEEGIQAVQDSPDPPPAAGSRRQPPPEPVQEPIQEPIQEPVQEEVEQEPFDSSLSETTEEYDSVEESMRRDEFDVQDVDFDVYGDEDHIAAEPEAPTEEMPETVSAGPFTSVVTPLSGTLYRETSVENLGSLLQATLTNSQYRGGVGQWFLSDDKDLALGQHGNVGVMVELDGQYVSGREHKKPGLDFAGSKEFEADYINRNAIKRFSLPSGYRLEGLPKVLANRHFAKTSNADGTTTYTRKGQSQVNQGVPAAETIGQQGPSVPDVSPTSRLDDLLERGMRREMMEQQGQEILDDMVDANVTPVSVGQEFWSDTYWQLSADGQARVQRMAKSLGFDPDTIGYAGQGPLGDWPSVGEFLNGDLPNSAEDLEGLERGYISFMRWANQQVAQQPQRPDVSGSVEYQPPAIDAVADETPVTDVAEPAVEAEETAELDLAPAQAKEFESFRESLGIGPPTKSNSRRSRFAMTAEQRSDLADYIDQNYTDKSVPFAKRNSMANLAKKLQAQNEPTNPLVVTTDGQWRKLVKSTFKGQVITGDLSRHFKEGDKLEEAKQKIYEKIRSMGHDGLVVDVENTETLSSVFGENQSIPLAKLGDTPTQGVGQLNIPGVEVVATTADIPGLPEGSQVKGLYDPRTRKTYVVQDQHTTREEAVQTAVHEYYGHQMMEDLPEYSDLMSAIREMSASNAYVKQKYDSLRPTYDRDTRARLPGATDEQVNTILDKEVIASITEDANVPRTVWRKIADAFRQWARNAGLNLQWNENDIKSFIRTLARSYQPSANTSGELPLASLPDNIEELRAQYMAPRPKTMLDRWLGVSDAPVVERLRGYLDQVKQNGWRKVAQGVADRAHAIGFYERTANDGEFFSAEMSPYKKFLTLQNSSGIAHSIIEDGVPMHISEDTTIDGKNYVRGQWVKAGFTPIKAIIERLHVDGKSLLEDWSLWAVATRAKYNITNGLPENKWTKQDADMVILHFQETGMTELFQSVHDDYMANVHNPSLDNAVAVGALDPEVAEYLKNRPYVPFMREVGEMEGSSIKGAGFGRPDLARLRGGEQRITSPMVAMMENAVALNLMARQTEAAREFRDMMVGNEEKVEAAWGSSVIEKVPMKMAPTSFTEEQIVRAMQKDSDDASYIQQLIEALQGMDVLSPNMVEAATQFKEMAKADRDKWVSLFRPVAPKGDDIITVMDKTDDGPPEASYYKIHDPLLVDSFNSLGHSFGNWIKLFSGPKNFLTTMTTHVPSFWAVNVPRDIASSWIQGGQEISLAPHIKNAISSVKDGLTENADLMEMGSSGHIIGGYHGDFREGNTALDVIDRKIKDPTEAQGVKDSIYRGWNWLTDKLDRYGYITEYAPRRSVYKQFIDAGATTDEAAFQAADVLNFSMRGDWELIRFFTTSIPFLNARIQSLYRGGRSASHSASTRKAMVFRGGMIMAATLALWFKNKDDERFKNLKDWDRDMFWHMWLGDFHVRFPRPFEYGLIFATIPERTFDVTTNENGLRELGEAFSRGMFDTLALNPLNVQTMKPLVEQWANRQMFFDAPIVPGYLSARSPEGQFSSSTSPLMRYIADAMPDMFGSYLNSPKRLEALFRAYTGTWGMYLMSAADSLTRSVTGETSPRPIMLERTPVIDRFFRGDGPEISKHVNDLYDMASEAEGLYNTAKDMQRQGAIEKARELRSENLNKFQLRRRLTSMRSRVSKLSRQMDRIRQMDIEPEDKEMRARKIIERINAVSKQYEYLIPLWYD